MSIDTATPLGFFALAGVSCIAIAWVCVSGIRARVQIARLRTEQAFYIKEAELARLEAARYAAELKADELVTITAGAA